jgi:hypothetical protein
VPPPHTHSHTHTVTHTCTHTHTPRSFPSSFFYDGRLSDGVEASSRQAPCHAHPLLGPLAVLDVRTGREAGGTNSSLFNTTEAELSAELYKGEEAGRMACNAAVLCCAVR